MEFTITLTGTYPYIMHSDRMVDPLDPITKEHKKLTSKRTNKTEADLMEIARLEFFGALYMDSEVGPYIPGDNFQRCLLDASRLNRLGAKFERGVIIDTNVNPLSYAGPRTAAELWELEEFRFRRSVKQGVGKSAPRLIKTRPIFRQWRCEAHGLLDETQLNLEELGMIAENAGTFTGIGDWRPRFGRFTAEVEKA